MNAALTPYAPQLREALSNRPPRPRRTSRPSFAAMPEIEQRILRKLQAAAASWQKSPEAKAAMQSGDLEALRKQLDSVIAGSRDLILQQRSLDASKISFPIAAVSIGFSAEADLIGGVYGSIGYAADIEDIHGSSVIYICGALMEGAIEGADVAVQVGLFKSSTSDLGGYYNGQTIDVTDFGGFAAWSLEQDDSVVAYLIDIAAGEDDGLAEVELYMFTIATSHPVVQPEGSHFLILTALTCENQSESGHDEVYFNFVPDTGNTVFRYPTWNYYAMTEDTSAPEHNWNCGRSVKFNSKVTVTLMDDSSNLGGFTFNYSDFNGAGSTVTKTSDIKNGFDEIKYAMSAKLIY